MFQWRNVRRAAEKTIAPGGNVSYAQAGEDLVLDFLVGHAPTGFYVDVGCNHPVRGSNTYRFYRKGWSGVAIDANPKFESAFATIRPRDSFIRACVSDMEEDVNFHVFREDALSSISGEPLYGNADHYALERVEMVRTRQLTPILAEAGVPDEFDILSIDVEGHDEPVIRSLDLRRYRPNVILVELNGTDFEPARVAESWTAHHLGEHGYTVAAIHWGNVFFRR